MPIPTKAEPQCPKKKPSRLFIRLLGLAAEFKSDVLTAFLLQAASVLFSVLVLYTVGYAIDTLRSVADTSVDPAGNFLWLHLPFENQPVALLWFLGGIVLLFSLIRMATQISANLVQAKLSSVKIVPALRTRVFDKLQRLSFRFFDTNSSSSLINRVTGDVQLVRSFIDEGMIRGLIIFTTLIVYLIYMLRIDVGLTLACLAGTPLMVILSVRFSIKIRQQHLKNRSLMDGLIQLVTDTVRGIRTLKGFSLQENVNLKFQKQNAEIKNQKRQIFIETSKFSSLMDALSYLNVAILLGYGGWLVMDDSIALGKGLVVFAGLLQQFTAQLTAVTQIVNRLQESMVGATRVFEILDAPVEVSDRMDALPATDLKGQVEFDHVFFQHSKKSEEAILKDLCFCCKPGMKIAILGATGAGKSVLMNLIPRFYDPSSGAIRIDGKDIRGYQLKSLRRQVGMVFQESFLFQGTVADNISFGTPDADAASIADAARLAGAEEFITRLPRQYDTWLREGGSNLSGGQRQRLAIARALITNPAILLLDDPTASLDPETDAIVQASLEKAMNGRSTFIVAHRVSTLKHANLILVLDRGKLVQAGTHEELIHQPGIYLSVARTQLNDPTAFQRKGGTS